MNRVARRAAVVAFATVFAAPALLTSAQAADVNAIYSPVYNPPMQQVIAEFEIGVGGIVASTNSSNGGIVVPLGARFTMPAHNGMNFTADISGTGFLLFNTGGAALVSSTGHLWKTDGNHAYGVFAGLTYAGDAIGTIGAEAAHYIGNKVYSGQIAAGTGLGLIDDPDINFSFVGARGRIDHYFTANHKLSLGAEVLYFDSTAGVGANIGIEKRHEDKPMSGFARAGVFTANGGTVGSALVGVRIFSEPAGMTLWDHDKAQPFSYSFTGNSGGLL